MNNFPMYKKYKPEDLGLDFFNVNQKELFKKIIGQVNSSGLTPYEINDVLISVDKFVYKRSMENKKPFTS